MLQFLSKTKFRFFFITNVWLLMANCLVISNIFPDYNVKKTGCRCLRHHGKNFSEVIIEHFDTQYMFVFCK